MMFQFWVPQFKTVRTVYRILQLHVVRKATDTNRLSLKIFEDEDDNDVNHVSGFSFSVLASM
jgi:hypothetical protein